MSSLRARGVRERDRERGKRFRRSCRQRRRRAFPSRLVCTCCTIAGLHSASAKGRRQVKPERQDAGMRRGVVRNTTTVLHASFSSGGAHACERRRRARARCGGTATLLHRCRRLKTRGGRTVERVSAQVDSGGGDGGASEAHETTLWHTAREKGGNKIREAPHAAQEDSRRGTQSTIRARVRGRGRGAAAENKQSVTSAAPRIRIAFLLLARRERDLQSPQERALTHTHTDTQAHVRTRVHAAFGENQRCQNAQGETGA